MFMPDKHIRVSESLLGLGGYLLEVLFEPRTVDQLWECYQADQKVDRSPRGHSLETIVLALDALFAIGAIVATDGVIRRCA